MLQWIIIIISQSVNQSYLQIGQEACSSVESQALMQSAWNVWPQGGPHKVSPPIICMARGSSSRRTSSSTFLSIDEMLLLLLLLKCLLWMTIGPRYRSRQMLHTVEGIIPLGNFVYSRSNVSYFSSVHAVATEMKNKQIKTHYQLVVLVNKLELRMWIVLFF